MSIQNISTPEDPFSPTNDPFSPSKDPFSTANLDEDDFTQEDTSEEETIHIRIQQRNGRKTLTTLQGLSKKYDHKKILKEFKRQFACNGTVINDETMGPVIQLQGDHRAKILEFLIEEGIPKDKIKVHGF